MIESTKIVEDSSQPLCTFAATGRNPAFQPIFICHSCASTTSSVEDGKEQTMPLCICQNCAYSCHKNCDVEYVGDGPSYCDCSSLGNDCVSSCVKCLLINHSKEAAHRLGMNADNHGMNFAMPISGEGKFPYKHSISTIEALLPKQSVINPCDSLIPQILELINHSSDTHWIPIDISEGTMSSSIDMCELEQLAFAIFQHHIDTQRLHSHLEKDSAGAEWWVQVKNIRDEVKEIDVKETEAIDLHYDKDEELAAAFDLGSFPTLSTVTYLTDNKVQSYADGEYHNVPPAPTLVFPHTYEMPDDGPIGSENEDEDSIVTNHELHQVIISHARVGKHLMFDGRLLHGVPSNLLLRQTFNAGQRVHRESGINEEESIHSHRLRVTFLVNIWLSRKPTGVDILPGDMRSAIQSKTCSKQSFLAHFGVRPRSIITKEVDRQNDVNENIARIQLPFVSKGATWIDDNEDNVEKWTSDFNHEQVMEEGLVLTMVPPLSHEEDTILVRYGKDLEPRLEHFGGDYHYDSDDEVQVLHPDSE